MANLQYSIYEGYGETAKKDFAHSQAVRVGDRVECSGQGGWDRKTSEIAPDLKTQIERSFDNIQEALRQAGLEKGFAHVFKLRSFHVGLDSSHLELLIGEVKKYCPNHQPTMTVVGVEKLALPGMLIEIEAEAAINGA